MCEEESGSVVYVGVKSDETPETIGENKSNHDDEEETELQLFRANCVRYVRGHGWVVGDNEGVERHDDVRKQVGQLRRR